MFFIKGVLVAHGSVGSTSVFGVRTVFVLGAGAHKDLGMPVGVEVNKKICKMLDGPGSLCPSERVSGLVNRLAAYWGHSEDEVRFGLVQILPHIRSGVEGGIASSIDTVSEASPWLRGLGRAIYAAIICESETSVLRSLGEPGGTKSIYDWLFPKLRVADSADGTKVLCPHDYSNFKIVTFNYDCLTELLADRWLVQAHPKSQSSICDRWAVPGRSMRVDVHHAYGQIARQYRLCSSTGRIESQDGEHEHSIRLSPHAQANSRFDEDLWTLRPDFASSLERAERVVFIGFGFDPTNLAVLLASIAHRGPKDRGGHSARLYSTGIGLDDKARTRIRESLRPEFTKDSVEQMQFGREDESVYCALTRWEADWT